MRRLVVVAALFFALVIGRPAFACSTLAISDDDVIENPKYTSANGMYVVVVREFPLLGDFASGRRGDFVPKETTVEVTEDVWTAFEDNEDSHSPFLPTAEAEQLRVEFVVYHRRNDRFLVVGRFFDRPARFLLVANDGAFFVEPPSDFCGSQYSSNDEFRVFTPRGAHLKFSFADVLSESDSLWMGSVNAIEVDDENPGVLRITLAVAKRERSALVDLSTGRRVGGKADLIGPPRVDVEASVEGLDIPPDRGPVVRVYPTVAFKAGVQGIVIIDFEANEEGTITSTTIVKGLPFGLNDAAEKAVREWTVPVEHRGSPAPIRGTAKVTFDLVPAEEES